MRARRRNDEGRTRRAPPRARPRARRRDARTRRTRTEPAASARATRDAEAAPPRSRPTRHLGRPRHEAPCGPRLLVVVHRREHRGRLVVGRRVVGEARRRRGRHLDGSHGSKLPVRVGHGAMIADRRARGPGRAAGTLGSRSGDDRITRAENEAGSTMSQQAELPGTAERDRGRRSTSARVPPRLGRRHAERRRTQGAADGRRARRRARHELRQAHQRARLRSSLQGRLQPAQVDGDREVGLLRPREDEGAQAATSSTPATSPTSSTASSRTTRSTSAPASCSAATSPRNATPRACCAVATTSSLPRSKAKSAPPAPSRSARSRQGRHAVPRG